MIKKITALFSAIIILSCNSTTTKEVKKDSTTTETVQVQKQKQKPSRAKRESSTDPRHEEFKQVFSEYFAYTNNGLDAPWDAQEGAQLKRFLEKNPRFNTEQWRILLRNRARSDVAHGENLSTWIAKALTWANAPTGKNGGSNGFKGKTESSVDAAKSAIATVLRGDEENRHRGSVDEVSRQATGEIIPPGLPGPSGRPAPLRSVGH